jgi:ATP-binding cassette subfamily B protein
MFNDTIRYNITFGENIEDAKVWEALKVAGAKEFVNELPDKLDTFVGEKGLKLSGGQRQRIAIARVWIKNPKIILMDEATSSLDSVSELKIKYAMDSLLKNRTSITIAHRLSTIVEADRILYMENGLIIEQGCHKELLEIKGKYYHLYSTQTEGLIIKNTI